MINIFNSNYEELGSLNKNLVLQTLGKIKIRYGKKFIDLLDNNGNINVLIPKVLKKVDSVDKMNTNGLYLIGDELWAYVDGEKILVEGEANKTFISYLSNLNLDLSLIDIALKNIGLKFDSLGEVNVNNSIVFVQDKIYYISNGNAIELTTTLNEPLKSINSSGLGSGAENSVLYFKNGRWTYAPLPTGDNTLQITLNEPIEGLNNANLGEPANGQILVYQNNAWSYINIPTSQLLGVLLNFPLSAINSAGISNSLTAGQPTNNAIVIAYDLNLWKPVRFPKPPTYIETIWWWTEEDMNNGGCIYYNSLFDSTINNPLLPLLKKIHQQTVTNNTKYFQSDGSGINDRPDPKYYYGPVNLEGKYCTGILTVVDELNENGPKNKYLVWDSLVYMKVFWYTDPDVIINQTLSTDYALVPYGIIRGPELNLYLNNKITLNYGLTYDNYYYYNQPNSWYEISGSSFKEPRFLELNNQYGFIVRSLWNRFNLDVHTDNNVSISSGNEYLTSGNRFTFYIKPKLEQQTYYIADLGNTPLILYVDVEELGSVVTKLNPLDIEVTLDKVNSSASVEYWIIGNALYRLSTKDWYYQLEYDNTQDLSGNETEIYVNINGYIDGNVTDVNNNQISFRFKVKYNNN